MASKIVKSIVAKRLMSSTVDSSRYVSPVSTLGELASEFYT